MFKIVSDKFFVPLASPNKQIYWECICKLFSIMNHQLSFGIERDVLVEELQYYFEQEHAIEIDVEEIIGKSSRDKANWMLRRLEFYEWIEIETDKSYVQRVNFKDYAVKIIKTLLEMLQKYQRYGKRLTENDRKRLQELQNQDGLKEIVSYMLENDVKLEQECIDVVEEPGEIY